jgi:hypothetical protein
MCANIRLGWKRLTGENNLAYYEVELIKAEKGVYGTGH